MQHVCRQRNQLINYGALAKQAAPQSVAPGRGLAEAEANSVRVTAVRDEDSFTAAVASGQKDVSITAHLDLTFLNTSFAVGSYTTSIVVRSC